MAREPKIIWYFDPPSAEEMRHAREVWNELASEAGAHQLIAPVRQVMRSEPTYRPGRLELVRARAQVIEKTHARRGTKNTPIADRPRLETVRSPIGHCQRPRSPLAELIAQDPVAQRIAQGLVVRPWCEATNARHEDDGRED